MGVEHSAQHLCSFAYAVLYMARVISQHTLLNVSKSPGQFFDFLAFLPQELKDVLPFLSTSRSTQVHFLHRSINYSYKIFHQRIVRREAGRNSCERVYPRTEVLSQFPEAETPLSRSRNTQYNEVVIRGG